MVNHKIRRFIPVLLLSALSFPALADSVTYQFMVDTSTQNANYGYIDLQLNPGTITPIGQVNATIFDFTGATLDASSIALTGNASGSLVSVANLNNGTSYNDYFEGLTFGSLITLDVELSGTGVSTLGGLNNASGTAMAVSFYDSVGDSLFVTDSGTGTAGQINVGADGRLETTSTFSPVPEPSTWTYFAISLALLPAAALWRKRSALFKAGPHGSDLCGRAQSARCKR
jgi:hypothetical protein